MGKTTGIRDRRNGRRRPIRLTAFGLVLSLAAAVPLAAQDAAPGGFSLPPGSSPQPSPPSDVQGPVYSDSTPPRRTDEPAEAAPPPVPTIAPVPVPQTRPDGRTSQRDAPASSRTESERAQQRDARQQQTATDLPETPITAPDDLPTDAPAAQPPGATVAPVIPSLPVPSDAPEIALDEQNEDGSIWWWLAAGLVALGSLIFMGMRQRTSARAAAAEPAAPVAPTVTVPTPPLRRPPVAPQPNVPAVAPFGTLSGGTGLSSVPAPAPAPAPAPPAPRVARPEQATPFRQVQQTFVPAAAPRPAPVEPSEPLRPAAPPAPAASQTVASATGPVPRLLLDFNTLGVDVTLVNAVARFHLAITNMADIAIGDLALHAAVVQARRGMPPTIDPLMGDRLLPLVQKMDGIAPGGTERCEGQIRLPLSEIEPIEMQGRLLFVPVVHIWIGYSGPDETRYAVTQSFVLGEESNPPGARVGPLRLDLGPRRFSSIGQRPLQPV